MDPSIFLSIIAGTVTASIAKGLSEIIALWWRKRMRELIISMPNGAKELIGVPQSDGSDEIAQKVRGAVEFYTLIENGLHKALSSNRDASVEIGKNADFIVLRDGERIAVEAKFTPEVLTSAMITSYESDASPTNRLLLITPKGTSSKLSSDVLNIIKSGKVIHLELARTGEIGNDLERALAAI